MNKNAILSTITTDSLAGAHNTSLIAKAVKLSTDYLRSCVTHGYQSAYALSSRSEWYSMYLLIKSIGLVDEYNTMCSKSPAYAELYSEYLDAILNDSEGRLHHAR